MVANGVRNSWVALVRKSDLMRFDSSSLVMSFDRPNLDHRITTKMSVGQYYWARSGALKAHATQVDLNEPFWFGLTDEELAEVYPYEDWILAANHLPNYSPTQDGLESDLFAGI